LFNSHVKDTAVPGFLYLPFQFEFEIFKFFFGDNITYLHFFAIFKVWIEHQFAVLYFPSLIRKGIIIIEPPLICSFSVKQ